MLRLMRCRLKFLDHLPKGTTSFIDGPLKVDLGKCDTLHEEGLGVHFTNIVYEQLLYQDIYGAFWHMANGIKMNVSSCCVHKLRWVQFC